MAAIEFLIRYLSIMARVNGYFSIRLTRIVLQDAAK